MDRHWRYKSFTPKNTAEGGKGLLLYIKKTHKDKRNFFKPDSHLDNHPLPKGLMKFSKSHTRGSQTGKFKLLSSGCFSSTGFGHSLIGMRQINWHRTSFQKLYAILKSLDCSNLHTANVFGIWYWKKNG